MRKYLVEFVEGQTVHSSKHVSASSSFMAACTASGREITFIGDQSVWLRVSEAGRAPWEYSYRKLSTGLS